MTDMADEITESIKARIQAELAERQQRRERLRAAIYRDNESGHNEHDVVFGHRPSEVSETRSAPAEAGAMRARADDADPYDDQRISDLELPEGDDG